MSRTASTKDRILDAAEQVLLRDGPTGLSVDAVLKKAGVSKGGFFHYFESKEALLTAVMDRLLVTVRARTEAFMRDDPKPRGRALRAQLRVALELPPAEKERVRALVLALVTSAMQSKPIAQRALAANEEAVAAAASEGVGFGPAIVVQLALDGLFLGESLGTLKLTPARRAAIHKALLQLVENTDAEMNPRRPLR